MRIHFSLFLSLFLSVVVTAGCGSSANTGFTSQEPSGSDDASTTPGDDDAGDAHATSPDDSGVAEHEGGHTPVTSTDSGSSSSPDAETKTPDAGMTADTDSAAGDGETGRLVGITAAHNAVRAMVSTATALPPLVWSDTLAAYAQQWATSLASSPSTCAAPVHRSSAELEAKDYGENLAEFGERGGSGNVSTAEQAVDGWASEKACWTYGTFMKGDACNMTCTSMLNSDGCGHYTQIVWRKSTQVGCGVATCMNGQFTEDIWICNYAPAGNIVGQDPY